MRDNITVLMAALEGEAYIGHQIDSILSQTVSGLRLVISDDGSADRTREILDQYQKWYPDVISLRHRIKEGVYGERGVRVPSAAMNFFWLLGEAKGDYILLSDQDDVWKNDKVKKLLRRMKELEERFGRDCPLLIHSDMEVVDEALSPVASSFFAYQHCRPGRTSFSRILTENPVTGGAVMMNQALAGRFTSPPEDCCMHDWWIALTAACFGVISCVREPLYYYRQHGNNVMGARRTGGVKDVRERLGRQAQVEERYGRMFAQAKAFGRMYGDWMTREQKNTLTAFLSLPLQSPAGRLRNIVHNRFFKSSCLQTLAQCVTIPAAKGERTWER